MPEEKPPQKPAREPQALSGEYHKARKQLMFWSGILFIWELVGIDLEKAKTTGGTAGAIVNSIKSTRAVPWVLVILVAYFLFKVTVEWYQCNASRRNLRASRIDFLSAWFVSIAAYALYFGQAISHLQFAEDPDLSASIVMGVLAPLQVLIMRHMLNFLEIKKGTTLRMALTALNLLMVLTFVVAALSRGSIRAKPFFIALTVGMILTIGGLVFTRFSGRIVNWARGRTT